MKKRIILVFDPDKEELRITRGDYTLTVECFLRNANGLHVCTLTDYAERMIVKVLFENLLEKE